MNTFKQTDIGLIPEDWELKTLEDVTEKLKAGGTPRTTEESYWNGDIPLVKVEDVVDASKYLSETNLYITQKGLINSSAYLLPKNSLLFTMYGTAGEVAINTIPVAPTQNVLGIIQASDIDSNFLYYALKFSKTGSLERIVDRTIFKHFTLAKAKRLLITVPPLPEQKKIAHVLSKIQQAIETQEQIIKTTQELKKALMQKLFTEGLPASGGASREPQKHTEIGPIPESWEVVTIGDIWEQRKESYSPDPNGNSIYVGLEHITTGEFYLSNHSYENTVVSSKYKFYNDDLLYGKLRPYLDKAVLVNSNGVCSTDIIVIKPKIDNKFLLSLLHSEKLLKHSIAHTSGVNHPRTSFDALSRFKFALPNPTEQTAIGSVIFKLEDKIITHQNYRNQLKDVFSSALNQLMTGQIRVKDIEFKLVDEKVS